MAFSSRQEWLPRFYPCMRIHRKGVVYMTAYEIIMVLLEALRILMSFSSIVIALLAFLDQRNKH